MRRATKCEDITNSFVQATINAMAVAVVSPHPQASQAMIFDFQSFRTQPSPVLMKSSTLLTPPESSSNAAGRNSQCSLESGTRTVLPSTTTSPGIEPAPLHCSLIGVLACGCLGVRASQVILARRMHYRYHARPSMLLSMAYIYRNTSTRVVDVLQYQCTHTGTRCTRVLIRTRVPVWHIAIACSAME